MRSCAPPTAAAETLMEEDPHARFAAEIMPHLDAAFTSARWLLRDDHDAEDVVQEAMMKALRFIGDCRSGSARGWLLAIVRNTALTFLQRHRPRELEPLGPDAVAAPGYAPDQALLAAEHRQQLRSALDRLPYELREALVLRELDGLSYKAIAELAQVPIGTVMSRLSRARARLDGALTGLLAEEP